MSEKLKMELASVTVKKEPVSGNPDDLSDSFKYKPVTTLDETGLKENMTDIQGITNQTSDRIIIYEDYNILVDLVPRITCVKTEQQDLEMKDKENKRGKDEWQSRNSSRQTRSKLHYKGYDSQRQKVSRELTYEIKKEDIHQTQTPMNCKHVYGKQKLINMYLKRECLFRKTKVIFNNSNEPSNIDPSFTVKAVDDNLMTVLKGRRIEELYECASCKIKFTHKEQLLRHNKIHVNQLYVKDLNKRIKMHTDIMECLKRSDKYGPPKQIYCSVCKMQFVSCIELETHMANCNCGIVFRCFVCKLAFCSKLLLAEHLMDQKVHR